MASHPPRTPNDEPDETPVEDPPPDEDVPERGSIESLSPADDRLAEHPDQF